MAINVICPSCHARFQVSDKYAGRKGPCPKCKGQITIPKLEDQVKIHERAHEGVKDSKGKLVLKPIRREEVRVRPLAVIGIVVGVAAAVGAAWLIRGMYASAAEIPALILAVGAVAIAPPLVFAGYTFLRNDELEPYRGLALLTRVAICSAVYALLWGLFGLVPDEYRGRAEKPAASGSPQPAASPAPPIPLANPLSRLATPPPATDTAAPTGGNPTSDVWTMLIVIAPFFAAGMLAALASLDLDMGSAFFHYCLYVLVCVVLRATMGLSLV